MKRSSLIACVVFAVASFAQAQIASDNASNYSGNWTNGSNFGTGFQPWTLTVNPGTGFAGAFIGDPSSAGITGMSPTSFGLFANPSTSGAFVNADRAFSSALGTGQTFSVQWGVNFDSNSSGNKGLNIYSGGTSGTELININMGGSATITINGNPMFSNYGTAAMNLNFQLLNATTLRVYGIGRDGSESYDNNFTIGAAPDAFRFYVSNLDTGDQRQPYFNNLSIVPEPSTYALAAIALLGLAFVHFRRRDLKPRPARANIPTI